MKYNRRFSALYRPEFSLEKIDTRQSIEKVQNKPYHWKFNPGATKSDRPLPPDKKAIAVQTGV